VGRLKIKITYTCEYYAQGACLGFIQDRECPTLKCIFGLIDRECMNRTERMKWLEQHRDIILLIK
jgi:hypothetical protein